MVRDPYLRDSEDNPLCYGEEYEEGHDICNECFAEDGCRRTFHMNKAVEEQKELRRQNELVSLRLPGQPYYPTHTPPMKSLFDVTNSIAPQPTFSRPSYTPTPVVYPNTNANPPTVAPPVVHPYQQLAPMYPNDINLMENPVFPNQFEGESPAIRLVKNSLLAGARMVLFEMYRGLESALSRYLWPPSLEED